MGTPEYLGMSHAQCAMKAADMEYELEQLRAENAELRKDAERYWLIRDQHQGKAKHIDAEWYEYYEPTPYGFTVFHSPNPDQCSIEPVGCIAGELDRVVDAAMEKQNANQ